jgi:trans-aconitate 2-methyltransferase
MTDHWNPQQYDRFAAERSQPFFHLAALVRAKDQMRVLDLGCGSGRLTRELYRMLRAAHTLGIDSSEAMLAESRAYAEPGLNFRLDDIERFHAPPGSFDLIFSNAAIQWVDDHEPLLARLTELLAPGGQVAIQMPANDDHPTHVIAAELASLAPYRDAMEGYVRQFRVLKPEQYSSLLHRLHYAEQHVRLQVYGHVLGSREDVVEWVKGTMLTDYQRRMPPELFDRFLADYRAALLPKLSDARPFFYPFKRILFWGVRSD